MSEQYLRVTIFFLFLFICSFLEVRFSFRERLLKRVDRWPANVGILFLSSITMKLLAPFGLLYFCNLADKHVFGFFNTIQLSLVLEIIISLGLLDLLIYFQHRISHHFPILWRIHRVHHADTDLDATSALRFHPLEIFLSFFFKAICILIFGISMEAIFIFEIVLSSMAIFNHSNLYIPAKLEKYLRWFIVTPQMHIIHHSVEQNESDTNYGFNISFWDKIFKTYSANFTSTGIIGQRYFRDKESHKLLKLLGLPFKNENNLK